MRSKNLQPSVQENPKFIPPKFWLFLISSIHIQHARDVYKWTPESIIKIAYIKHFFTPTTCKPHSINTTAIYQNAFSSPYFSTTSMMWTHGRMYPGTPCKMPPSLVYSCYEHDWRLRSELTGQFEFAYFSYALFSLFLLDPALLEHILGFLC